MLRLEPDLEVVATCLDGRDALEAVRRHAHDPLLLDPARGGPLYVGGLSGTVIRAGSAAKVPPYQQS